MKKVLLSISIVALILSSCSKDDSSSESSQGNQNIADEQNATEETQIPLSVLESGLTISGGQKINGAAPPVNSDLTFTINSGSEAFQDSGLDITFSGGENITGAYIQFKDTDGNALDSYFDVPAAAFNSEFNGGRKKLNINSKQRRSAKIISQDVAFESNDVINIGFENVPAGQFCYDICLYDADQNVYVIQEVCVEVEAWGGNASIVGSWEFSRFEGVDTDRNDIEFIDPNGNRTNEFDCTSGGTVVVDFSDEGEEEVWSFNLNEDGTYSETYIGSSPNLNFRETVDTCTLVFDEPFAFSDRFLGNWAFNEEDNTLTVIDFRYEDLLEEDNNRDYPNGELYFEGVSAEVVNGELKMEDEDGAVVYFTRK